MLQINLLNPHKEPGITVLALQGQLDGLTYNNLVNKAIELYKSGTRCILLDLSNLQTLNIAGLAALHSVARLLRGDPPHDMEMGWSVFHEIRHTGDVGLQPGLKIYNPQPNVAKVLNSSRLDQTVEIYHDYTAALSSFICHDTEVPAI
jgi:anti-anti-sigma regulatory factor